VSVVVAVAEPMGSGLNRTQRPSDIYESGDRDKDLERYTWFFLKHQKLEELQALFNWLNIPADTPFYGRGRAYLKADQSYQLKELYKTWGSIWD